MTFRELEYAIAIDMTHNLSRAAEMLYTSQPTLTKFLQNCEEQLGITLFERMGNKYYLTYEGERYIHYAKQILQMEQDMNAEMEDLSKRKKGRLRIGCQMNRAPYIIPLTIPIFHERFPEVELSLRFCSSKEFEQLLLNGELDLVLFNYPERNPLLDYRVISQEDILLITPPNHPLGKTAVEKSGLRYPEVDLSLFADEPFIIQPANQTSGRIAREIFKKAGINPPVFLEFSNIPGSIRLVSSGCGCAVLVSSQVREKNEQHYPIEYFYIKEQQHFLDLVVATRKSGYLTHHAEFYIQLLQEITNP